MKERISTVLENELSNIYNELGIDTGDITPEQYLQWEELTSDLATLFLTLIEQNK